MNVPFCSGIGATVISTGFHTVMWGKAKEEMGQHNNDVTRLESPPTHTTPLLQSRNISDRQNYNTLP